MESDKYKVELLHYINPHLIWVLVEDKEAENNYRFEQIGIYGILPLDVAIDYEGNVTTNRCKDWLPAVFVAMKELLHDATQVSFSVTFLDKTTSIFDDNLHKYGDLEIKFRNGTTVSMTQKLLETGFVAEDVQCFHQQLNTKLDYVNTVNVINKINQSIESLNKPKNMLQNILKEQMSIFYKAIELEEKMPSRNLDLTGRVNHTQMLLRKQLNDLNACKDVDEESAGRACMKGVESNEKELSSGLRKKLNMVKCQAADSKVKSKVITKKEDVDVTIEEYNQESPNNNVSNTESPKTFNNKNKKRGKPKGNDNNKDKKLIAFGPPGLNPTQYSFKEIKEEENILIEIKEEIITEDSNITEPSQDIFDKADSEVNIRLSKRDILKLKTKFNAIEKENKIVNSNENSEIKSFKDDIQDSQKAVKLASSALSMKMKILKEKMSRMNDSASTLDTDSVRQGDDSDSESISALVDKLDISNDTIRKEIPTEPEFVVNNVKNNVNPFKNLDGSKSVFVEKLVSPTVMVHTKKGNCIQPVTTVRDVAFGTSIHVVLRNMGVTKPMRTQTVSWPTILRGHSLFLVSPYDSGKTLGYLPAVCRLVSDSIKSAEDLSVARLTCIIVCATATSVYNIEEFCKMFLHEARIFAYYAGMTDVELTTSLLNGCDILICTPISLVRMMRDSLGLDLRHLNTLVIDDCERISEVYRNELKFCLLKVREMLKTRVNKELKVQYIVASRIWCSFMSSLAKKSPDSIVCIGGFQECVLYSQVDTSVEFLAKQNKVEAVLKFMGEVDKSKKTVIACRHNDEVHLITKALTSLKYVVFACDSNMTVQDLYGIDLALSEYKEPVLGPILVCCDANLTHLNMTDAHYLIHFSLPEMFSTFCKRFAVLIDNYSSIFDNEDSGVKIKILLDNSNVEQLPKILHFIKRCTDNVPPVLDEICNTVTAQKDIKKAQMFVPLCSTLLSLGKCPNIWQCKQRHAILKNFDEPRPWMPTEGTIFFKILHYHSAVYYSVRMLSCITNNVVKKYPQTYSMISVKLGMYYSKEINKKLHGIAKPGDICAVAIKHNLFARCQVLNILKYTENNVPCLLLINLIDEEKYEMARDTCLYYLPDELKTIETQAVRVILDNLAPQDRDISYSKLAEQRLKNITEKNEDLYMRGQISLVIGNCIFVETLEACQDLSSFNETVVKSNFKNELLDGYVINNPDHISSLQKLGEDLDFMRKKEVNIQPVEVPKPIKLLPKARWAHLESDNHVPVYYLYAITPEQFFVQHVKFQDCLNTLIKDIKKYVSENPQPVEDVKEGDILLAEFPDDVAYERARIDSVIGDNKVKCFFVDLGDWRVVSTNKLLPITEKLITQLPFQAIECRLVGIKPLGNEWSEFSTNWLVDQFYDSSANLKYLFAKRFTKERAQFTEGSKYSISLIDTYANDVCINKLMLDANLAEENDEIEFLNKVSIEKDTNASLDDNSSTEETCLTQDTSTSVEGATNDILAAADKESSPLKDNSEINGVAKLDNGWLQSNKDNQLAIKNSFQSSPDSSSVSSEENIRTNQQKVMNLFRKNPIRSVPLVEDDNLDDDRWDTQNPMLMLMDGNRGTKITEISDTNNKPKIVPLAITKSVPNNAEPKLFSIPAKQAIPVDQNQNETFPTKPIAETKVIPKETKLTRQSNIVWSVLETENKVLLYDNKLTDDDKKITLIWSQDINSVNIQIQVVVEKYELNLKNRGIQFYTNANNEYGFELELYGVIDTVKSNHCKKDSCIEVKLSKLTCKKWLKLIKGDIKKYVVVVNKTLDTDDTSKVKDEQKVSVNNPPTVGLINKKYQNNHILKELDTLRKPKVVWRQNRYKVTIKILLITEKYDLVVKERYLKFDSNANDEQYGFEIELYGIVDVDKTSHSNKGQYILVTLTKVMAKNWLTLSKGTVKKWIVYDVDNIDVSSEDETASTDELRNLQKSLNIKHETDSEDDFDDDTNFGYAKRY